MASPTPSARKNNKTSISGIENIEKVSSAEDVDCDTGSNEENVLPVMKSKSPSSIEILNARNDLCAKFFRRLSVGSALSDLRSSTIKFHPSRKRTIV